MALAVVALIIAIMFALFLALLAVAIAFSFLPGLGPCAIAGPLTASFRSRAVPVIGAHHVEMVHGLAPVRRGDRRRRGRERLVVARRDLPAACVPAVQERELSAQGRGLDGREARAQV